MSKDDFDLIVVGGGSGGLAAAFRAAEHGAKVAMLEPQALGGTCVNAGCVPKKAMWFAAELGQRIRQAQALGYELPEQPSLDWSQLLVQRGRYIANIHEAYRKRLQEAGIVHLPHRGRLTETPGEVVCDAQRWRAPRLLLATGASAVRPDIPGAELGSTSDDFFALRQAPVRVAVIGGGYVGVELACLLQALGSRVEMFVREGHVLDRFDREMTTQLAAEMRRQGIRLHFDSQVDELRRTGKHEGKGEDSDISVIADGQAHAGFDMVLFAIGRRPNTGDLGLDAAGVRCGERGEVEVDDCQRTSRKDVFAVGDVTGQPALTPFAIAAARRLMDRLFDGQDDAKADFALVPSVVFAHPPLAAVGLTEAQAREQHGDEVAVYRADFRPMRSALADCGPRSLFKVICAGPQQTVVGLHLLGESVDEMLQGFAVAMQAGMRLRDLQDTLAIHPTSAEEVVLIRD